ncbi:MAG TPA: carboxymuconolactone decarboxylase family protein [Ignavibacteria bacterium]|nr:carboxymuconolactone decarboxylase family protein [Ignavibacteria bacterium]HMR39212.1 carboxymuconolactone decarboxylase family protein [Ignavibacteria bacterium]
MKFNKFYKEDIKLISKISAYIALDKLKNTKNSIIEYKSSEFSQLKLYEAILQTYLFCGFPAAIESLRIFNRVFDNFKFPEHSQKYDFNYLMSEGEINCNLIYKNNYKKLIENMNNFSPDLKEWMILEGYGKVMGRKGLNLPEREIINVTILTARYYKHQLHSHLRGCLNVGISSDEVIEIIGSFNGFISKTNVNKCKKLFESIIRSP